MTIENQLTRIFADGDQPKAHEHPDDQEMRVKAIEEGKAQEAAVLRDYGPLLAKLVTTYTDAAAKDALEALREAFWTNVPAGLSGSETPR